MIFPRHSLLALCAAAATVLAPLAVRADTVTIGPSQDNSIFQNNVNNSNGGGPGIFSGTNGAGSPRRGLIEFNVAGSIPAGATITSVSFQLTVGQLGGMSSMGRTINLYDLTAGWGEGTVGASATIGGTGQGSPAATGDATWNANHYNVSNWTTAGGDHSAVVSGTATLGTVSLNSQFTFSSLVMVADVQNWLDAPAANNGWEIINGAEGTAQSLLGFYSKEGTQVSGVTAGQLPLLTINYNAPVIPAPEPAGGVLLLAGAGLRAAGVFFRRQRRRQA